MRNLNSLSFADSCYEGENCHQAGDKGKEGVEKEQARDRGKERGEGGGGGGEGESPY